MWLCGTTSRHHARQAEPEAKVRHFWPAGHGDAQSWVMSWVIHLFALLLSLFFLSCLFVPLSGESATRAPVANAHTPLAMIRKDAVLVKHRNPKAKHKYRRKCVKQKFCSISQNGANNIPFYLPLPFLPSLPPPLPSSSPKWLLLWLGAVLPNFLRNLVPEFLTAPCMMTFSYVAQQKCALSLFLSFSFSLSLSRVLPCSLFLTIVPLCFSVGKCYVLSCHEGVTCVACGTKKGASISAGKFAPPAIGRQVPPRKCPKCKAEYRHGRKSARHGTAARLFQKLLEMESGLSAQLAGQSDVQVLWHRRRTLAQPRPSRRFRVLFENHFEFYMLLLSRVFAAM